MDNSNIPNISMTFCDSGYYINLIWPEMIKHQFSMPDWNIPTTLKWPSRKPDVIIIKDNWFCSRWIHITFPQMKKFLHIPSKELILKCLKVFKLKSKWMPWQLFLVSHKVYANHIQHEIKWLKDRFFISKWILQI